MLRIDLHVHTTHSTDGHCTLARAVEAARAKGLNGMAITDHNTIAGHAEAKKLSSDKFLIIPGVEIASADGHIIGLGIKDLIPKGLPAGETVRLIKEQGGVAIAAHPFELGCKPSLVYKAKFDAIEGLNARAVLLGNPLAQRFAAKNKLTMVAGSDAHRCDEIGLAYTLVDCQPKIDSVLEIIVRGGTSIAGETIPLPSFLWRILQKTLRWNNDR